MVYVVVKCISVLCLLLLCNGRVTPVSGIVRYIRSKIGVERPRHEPQNNYEYTVQYSRSRLSVRNHLDNSLAISVGKAGVVLQQAKHRKDSPQSGDKRFICHGIFGVYKLPAGYYLALIKDSRECMDMPIKGLRKITKVELVKIPSAIPLPPSFNATAVAEQQERAELLLLDTFRQHTLCFSTGPYDITRTYQSNMLTGLPTASTHFTGLEATNERFFWNLNSARPLLEQKCEEFVMPVVNIWFSSANISHEGTDYTLTLLSRRSRRRQGPRYIKRGADELGDVANFVETEQILQRSDADSGSKDVTAATASSSFVQVRGSVPALWQQPAEWKLRPLVRASSATELPRHAQVLKTHLLDLASAYFPDTWGWARNTSRHHSGRDALPARQGLNTIHVVNLIDRKGTQGKLGLLLTSAWQLLQSTKTRSLRRFGVFHAPRLDGLAGAPVVEGGSPSDSDNVASASVAKMDRGQVHVDTAVLHLTTADAATLHSTCAADEALLGESESGATGHIPISARHSWFDYHHKCKDGPLAAAELFPSLQDAVSSTEGIFTVLGPAGGSDVGDNTNRRVVSVQRHLIRTNCMDCLDRTNVMQSVFARWALVRQLAALHLADATASGVRSKDAKGRDNKLHNADRSMDFSLPNEGMESEFRRLWTENGDHLSLMYAGSRAMKRDVTRNGVRTQRGAVDDAVAAARRYFTNNLRDLRKQLGIDALLGLAPYEELYALHGLASSPPPSVIATRAGDEEVRGRGQERNPGGKSAVGAAEELEQYAPLGHRQAHSSCIVSSLSVRHMTRKNRMQALQRPHTQKTAPLRAEVGFTAEPVLQQPHPKEITQDDGRADVVASEEQDELSALLADIVHHVERLIFK